MSPIEWPKEKTDFLVAEAQKRTTFKKIAEMLNSKYPDTVLTRSACIGKYTRLRIAGRAPTILRTAQKRQRPPPPGLRCVPTMAKIRSQPKPPEIEEEIYEPIKEVARPVVNGREPCHLLDLTHDSCRWVIENQLFCNLVREPGYSYCPTHRRAAKRKAGHYFDRDDDLLIMRLWSEGAKPEEIASQIGCAPGDIVYRATQKLRLKERRA